MSTVKPVVFGEWQPISTLPRDGTRVLVWAHRLRAPTVKWDDGTGQVKRVFTHWTPLPPLPLDAACRAPESPPATSLLPGSSAEPAGILGAANRLTELTVKVFPWPAGPAGAVNWSAKVNVGGVEYRRDFFWGADDLRSNFDELMRTVTEALRTEIMRNIGACAVRGREVATAVVRAAATESVASNHDQGMLLLIRRLVCLWGELGPEASGVLRCPRNFIDLERGDKFTAAMRSLADQVTEWGIC